MQIIKKLFSLKNRNIIVAGGAGQIGFSFVEILLDSVECDFGRFGHRTRRRKSS